MPATTRSANRASETDNLKNPQKTKASNCSSGAKRKGSAPKLDDTTTAPPPKKQKASKDSEDTPESGITINRAPVLELWTASVTHFLHPDLPWTTCLSAGGAVATITAISKGRSIGKIDKLDPSEAAERKAKREKQGSDLDEIEVMGFHLKLKDGVARVGDRGKAASEEGLKKKYGGDGDYSRAKKWFNDALHGNWKGREEELNRRAFAMYEDFRPTVPAGQKGWGRKGLLEQSIVQDAIEPG